MGRSTTEKPDETENSTSTKRDNIRKDLAVNRKLERDMFWYEFELVRRETELRINIWSYFVDHVCVFCMLVLCNIKIKWENREKTEYFWIKIPTNSNKYGKIFIISDMYDELFFFPRHQWCDIIMILDF